MSAGGEDRSVAAGILPTMPPGEHSYAYAVETSGLSRTVQKAAQDPGVPAPLTATERPRGTPTVQVRTTSSSENSVTPGRSSLPRVTLPASRPAETSLPPSIGGSAHWRSSLGLVRHTPGRVDSKRSQFANFAISAAISPRAAGNKCRDSASEKRG